MDWKKGDFRWLIHTPAELATSFVKFAQKRRDGGGVTFGIPAVDKKVIPLSGGDYVGIIARPSHGKSSLLAAMALREARRIQNEKRNEIAVVVTWEQMAEEFEMMIASGSDAAISSSDIAWGRVDDVAVNRWAVKRAQLPVWTIGYGAFRTGNAPRMTLSSILSAIENIEQEFGVKPALVTLDYLQLIPSERGRSGDRTAHVTEASNRIKELALRVDCPFVVGVQARREVDDRKDKMPTMRDGQWTSNIEQDTDKLFGLVRPIRYVDQKEEGNEWVRFKGKEIQVTPTLCFLRMLKQRFEDGQHTWALHFRPEFLQLAEMEMESVIGEVPF